VHAEQAHGGEIKENDDLFYTWQYDLRWVAAKLREEKLLKSAQASERNVWVLV